MGLLGGSWDLVSWFISRVISTLNGVPLIISPLTLLGGSWVVISRVYGVPLRVPLKGSIGFLGLGFRGSYK